MAFGLSNNEEQFLKENLIDSLKKLGCEVYLFGSRANGTFKKYSDIDITYKITTPIKEFQIFKILEIMENSNFVYKIDLVNFDEIAASYKSKIESEMIRM